MSESVCPGCHRHCDLTKPRCGYGKKYAEKHLRVSEENPSRPAVEDSSADERLARDLIRTGKALKRAEKPRGERLGALTDEEKAALAAMLRKIAGGVGLDLEKKKGKRREEKHPE